MTSSATRMEVLRLYKTLLRESAKFSSYNFRNYALRRVKDAFRQNKTLTEENQVRDSLREGYRNLDVIRRQTLIGGMYDAPQLVIEIAKKT